MEFYGRVLILALVTLLLFSDSVASAAKLGEVCRKDSNCGAGLQCDGCHTAGCQKTDGVTRCTQIKPVDPFSRVFGLPFNRYAWLTTHNSFAVMEVEDIKQIFAVFEMARSRGKLARELRPEVLFLATWNQQDSIPSQLNNGVRGLILVMYDYKDDIWLCHPFEGSTCINFTSVEPVIDALNNVREFLEANPYEIVTIMIEDYVTSPNGLTKVFNAAGLRKFWFPVSRMPKNGGDWPTVDDMIEKNQRLVVFTSNSSKEATEGIAYQWKYTVENQNGNNGMVAGKCPNRGESPAMNTITRSLIVMNHFHDHPSILDACLDNSAPLMDMLNTCYEAAGKRWPNFIVVDFYKKSDGGGAPQAVDKANGQLICGRPDIRSCRVIQGGGVRTEL